MQQSNSVSFFAPGFDDTIEQQKIERQRKLADSLMQQSQAQPKGQMVGQIYVPPSWTEGLANVLKAYQGGAMQRGADTSQSALAQAMQDRNKQEAKDFFATLRGTPAAPEQNFGSSPSRDLMYGEKNLDLTGQAAPDATISAQAAIPGDQNKAIEMAFNAKSPMVQGYGSQLASGQLQQQQMMDKLAAAFKMAGGQAPGQAAAPGAPAASGGAAASPAPGAGGFGGVNPLAAALAVSGDTGLGKLGEMVAKANEPMINRGFGINKLNPVTGTYDLDAGSLQGIKDVEEAKADVASKHDMVKVDLGNGQYAYKPRAQLAGQQPPAPSMPAPAQPGSPRLVNQGQGTLTPQLQAAILADAAKNGITAPTVNMTAPGVKNPVFGFQPTPQPSPQGVAPQAAPVATPQDMPPQAQGAPNAAQVPSGAPVYGQSTTDLHLQGERGKMLADQEAKINADAESALAKLAQNNKMVDLIPSITTGPGAKALTTVRTLAQNLGVDIGDPAPNQEFEKYAIKGALEGAKQIYGARLTNQDVMSQIASNPGTTMADKALYELIKYDNIIQQRHLDKQEKYFSYTGPKEQFGMWFNQNNPYMGLTAPSSGQSAAQTAPGRPTPAATAPAERPSRLKPNPDGSFTYTGH